ncbi:MAG: DNA replication/repair protein RecF [Rhizobiaceae bacterium]|nr:DNA replication/repair protein RecF [Rhizobiaceae bacterium]
MAHQAPVFLTRLKLTDYRNYLNMSLEVDQRHVVLTGDNGAGKTNLLEAVSFLTPGRGMRRAAYDAVARNGGNGTWSVFAELNGAMGNVSIGTGLRESALGVENSRKTRINTMAVKSGDELLDHLRLMWLIPAMDGLFTGPASERRRYLDRLVLAIDPAHGRRVSNFEKSMRSRNKILADDAPDAGWLDAVEIQMAEHGVAIASARVEVISLLSVVIVKSGDAKSPFPDALIQLDGTLESMIGEVAASDVETHYIDTLRDTRRLDAAARRTLQGPHRTDMKVTHRPKSMPAALCSTGEQKALLIGLMLAHAQLTGELHGYSPVLLLDEIAAHLDSERRAAMFDMIEQLGCQAWMCGTDRHLFEALGSRANYFHVEDGTLRPLDD